MRTCVIVWDSDASLQMWRKYGAESWNRSRDFKMEQFPWVKNRYGWQFHEEELVAEKEWVVRICWMRYQCGHTVGREFVLIISNTSVARQISKFDFYRGKVLLIDFYDFLLFFCFEWRTAIDHCVERITPIEPGYHPQKLYPLAVSKRMSETMYQNLKSFYSCQDFESQLGQPIQNRRPWRSYSNSRIDCLDLN